MLLLTTIVNLFSSYLIASMSRELSVIFISFFALIILNLETLSLFKCLNEFGIVILSVIFCVSISLIFKYKKYEFLKINFDFKRLKNSLKLDKTLQILSLAFLFLLGVSFVLANCMPVLEPDSQTYHFFRVCEFYKNHSLNHFESPDIRALIMPINSEILYTYMYAFKKNFTGYGLVSFVSFLVCIISAWQICESFKFSFRKRLWAIFIFSSLSAIIVQISSMQTDILIGALLLLGLNLYIKRKIYFSSLCIAIAFGVKSTGLISFAGFLVLILAYDFIFNKKIDDIKKFLLCLFINFLIFSSYNYFLNLIQFHNPFANNAAYIGHKFHGGLKGYFANLINFLFQSLDFTGFKWGFYLNDKIIGIRSEIFDFLSIGEDVRGNYPMEALNIFTDEQRVGFGVLGFILFLPTIFVSLFKSLFARNKKIIFLGVLAFVFLLNIFVLSGSVAYMVYSIRFVVAFVCLSFLILLTTYKKRSILKPVFVFFCLFYMLLVSTHIVRMPFFSIVKALKKVEFNQEKFVENCYKGKVIVQLEIAPKVVETIKTKYPDCKKIAYIRGTFSSVLYVRTLEQEGYEIDFLTASLLDKNKLKKYDLIILESQTQDDNVFNIEDVKINYQVVGESIRCLKDDEICCYYTDIKNNKAIENSNEAKNASKRNCIVYPFLLKNSDFKYSYIDAIDAKSLKEKINVYYFINQIKD